MLQGSCGNENIKAVAGMKTSQTFACPKSYISNCKPLRMLQDSQGNENVMDSEFPKTRISVLLRIWAGHSHQIAPQGSCSRHRSSHVSNRQSFRVPATAEGDGRVVEGFENVIDFHLSENYKSFGVRGSIKPVAINLRRKKKKKKRKKTTGKEGRKKKRKKEKKVEKATTNGKPLLNKQ